MAVSGPPLNWEVRDSITDNRNTSSGGNGCANLQPNGGQSLSCQVCALSQRQMPQRPNLVGVFLGNNQKEVA